MHSGVKAENSVLFLDIFTYLMFGHEH